MSPRTLRPAGNAGRALCSSTRSVTGSSRGMSVPLLVVLVAGFVPLSGCLIPFDGELDPGPRVGYQQVDVHVHPVGQAPQNLTAATFAFDKFAFYEQETRRWVALAFMRNVSLSFDEMATVYVATVMLPEGDYSRMWGSLGSVEVWEEGTARPAVSLAERCHVPVSMKIEAGAARPVLTLYVFPEDALVKEGDTWFARPAFSGSLSQPSPAQTQSEGEGEGEGKADEGKADEGKGNPRFTRPQCEKSA